MALPVGTHIGPYEILAAIGAGGMGEVYRARDAKLGRDVALKVLPEAFARDAERMARFQREAKVLASLNHPNIATIHGLEDSGATHALVMELVEGPTLADRIKAGPIPVGEALPIARQITEALEYAHERGIVHRDLKPSNVKVTSGDSVMVLDFGLAKAIEGDPASMDISTSPTVTRMATLAGVLLGTAAYMSPEQAKAKPADRRADIWAFGCVLYEMLSGKMAFRGETVTDTLAAVIKEEPDWSQLPSNTPVRVRVLLQRCLQKDPKQRLQAIGDARIALEEAISGAPDPIGAAASERLAGKRALWLVSAVAGLAILAAASLAFLFFHKTPAPSAQVVRFEVPLPDKVTASGGLILSPDGRKFAFIARGADGQSRVWIRTLETIESHPLDGTEGASDAFWSADSRFIVFVSPGKMRKVESAGGPPLTLCDVTSYFGGAWNRDDQIVFGTADGISQVPASGGSPAPLVASGNAGAPAFLADGRHFIYTRVGPRFDDGGIYLGSVDSKPQDQPSKKLLADLSSAVYAPSLSADLGYLLFVRGASAAGSAGTLMAQPFDLRSLSLTGEAVPIAEQVSSSSFSVAPTGVLVYLKGSAGAASAAGVRGLVQGQLTWFDRNGKSLEAVGEIGSYRTLALSPDGTRVAFDRADAHNPSVRNIWLYEFTRGVTTRFTFDSGLDFDPVWSPDGSRIAFTSSRDGSFNLYQKLSNLAAEDEPLLKSNDAKASSSWSPDGRYLLYFNPVPPAHQWLLPLSAETDRKPVRVDSSEFNEAAGRISPDGRWIAYTSDESGKQEIYVRPLDVPAATGASPASGTPVTGKWMVSKDGGTTALWRGDGKELFYLSAVGGNAMAVEVSTSGVFQAGVPKSLFKVPPGVLFWDVSPDGKRFLMAAPSETAASAQAPFTVVLNWQAALKK
jgi:eukaryotic-like serine/threonine-protein kinase